MFEEMTYDSILKEKLEKVDSKYDKREGSLIFDALAPNSAEDATVYTQMSWMYDQQHGETANRENLIQIAKDTRGLTPEEATHAIIKAVFACEDNCELKVGDRFSHAELNYVVTEQIEGTAYKIKCETAGNAGNKYLGQLIPINYIQGLKSATMTEILIYGEDEEDTEVFRQRWRESFNGYSFGGNKEEYRQAIKKIPGVGGVKVDRATNASGEMVGGYVRCTIISSNYDVPSSELVNQVQTIIDPEVSFGNGDGLAPIGVIAQIVAVTGVAINVSTTLTYDTGYSFDALKSQLESAIDAYLLELRKEWEDNGTSKMYVRKAMIESALLRVNGVLDIADTMLNDIDGNVELDAYSIPLRGDLNG